MSIGNSRNLINAVNERARTQEQQPKNSSANGDAVAGRAVDVTANTHRKIAQSYLANHPNLSQELPAAVDSHLEAYVQGIKSVSGNSDQGKSFVGEAVSTAKDVKDAAVKGWSDVEKAKGPLGKFGAVMNSLTGIEQALSEVFSVIPFPAMPAARVFDLALGFPHGHTHPPTYGTPLPSIGPVIPLPWGFSGAENTTINGRKAARCGDMGIGVWCGGYFPIYEILLGSSSVWIEGSRAARMGVDLTQHCTFSKMPEPKDIPEVGIPLGLMVTASENVIIGGFPLPSLLNMLMGGVFKLLGKGLGKAVRAARKAAKKAESEAAKEVAEDAAKGAKKAPRKPRGSRANQKRCTGVGEPVDAACGRVFTSQTDFELAGRIPIVFTRIYDTSAIDYEGPLGWGWMHPYDLHLWLDDQQDMVIMRNEEALPIGFNQIAIGEEDFNPLEKRWLERLDEKVYVVRSHDGLRFKFTSIRAHDSAIEGKSETTAFRLIEIEDRNGNRIDFFYEYGRLLSLKDGAGINLKFSYKHLENSSDRLIGVSLVQDEKTNRTVNLINFTYDTEGCLVGATDQGLVPWRYTYDEHLLVKVTNRNGLSFQFSYRGEGKDARCVHTRGDRGIYERWLYYDTDGMRTIVEDSRGGRMTYYFNEFHLPVRLIDALGGESRYTYGSKGELLSETDEIGRTTKYKYNELCECIYIANPDGTTRRYEYIGDSLPQKLIDEDGVVFQHVYDQCGNITATIDALGNRNEYFYTQFGELEKIVDPFGEETKFRWNERGQIIEITTPTGAITRYGYDELGRLSWNIDPLGYTTRHSYNSLGRLLQVERSDDTTHFYEYDPEGNLTKFVNANGAETNYRYIDYNKLGERVDALGYTRNFVYDTEGNLIETYNECGEVYRFNYDALGRVISEVGFDGLTWKFDYDPASQLIARTDPAGQITNFICGLRGQLLEKLRPDGTSINFSYNRIGLVIGAKMPGSEIEFERDALGQIIRELQNGMVIEYKYDALGRRIKRHSSLGNTVEFIFDADSQMTRLQTSRGSMEFEYDKAGRIVRQRMPGELVESFYYDRCGRLIEQSLHNPSHFIFIREYKYDSEGNLIEFKDNNNRNTRFVYDPVERLREVTHQDKKIEPFIYDSVGNILRRGNRKFRYGLPDRLTSLDDTSFIYDEIGNLIERRCAGSVTSYRYDSDNRLKAILSSEEGGRVEFNYDAFGRRITKISENGETHFLWDGGVLLSEQTENRSTEYIFGPGSYQPISRFDADHFDTFHHDHIGTPHELTDEMGQVVWQADYDVYGQATRTKVGIAENQIRFQGQYEDRETGLHYNLNRYFDSEIGRYINQDPIGLLGGINLYSYTQNPVNWLDPSGLNPNPNPSGSTKIKYGDDLSKYAIEYRKLEEAAGRPIGGKNVAIIEYRLKGGKIAHIPSISVPGVHSEVYDELLEVTLSMAYNEEFDPDRVKRIYSEFEPCGGEHGDRNCAQGLKRDYPHADITHSFDYYHKSSRSNARKEKKAALKCKGVK